MSLIRVLEIPTPTGRFHFDGGEPQTFIEVDWFRDDGGYPPDEREAWTAIIEQALRGKKYFRADRAYLVLHPKYSFTVNYDPDSRGKG